MEEGIARLEAVDCRFSGLLVDVCRGVLVLHEGTVTWRGRRKG